MTFPSEIAAQQRSLALLVAMLAGFCLTPAVRALARAMDVIDMPEARRIHSVPTPRWGGLAVYLGAASPLLVFALNQHRFPGVTEAGPQTWIFCIASTILMLVGLADDRRSIRPVFKLLLEVAGATAVALAGYRIRRAFGIELGLWSVPITVLWIAAFVNAFNMVDGLDGLAAGLAVIMSIALTLVSVGAGDPPAFLNLILLSICGALLGFLPYNFNPATIFMGDSGSIFVGFVLATASVANSAKGSSAATLLLPILALSLPLAELSLTVLRRMLRSITVVRSDPIGSYAFRLIGKPALFTADGEHIHHRLIARGMSQRTVVLLMYAICIALNVLAFTLLAGKKLNPGIPLLAVILLAVIGVRSLGYRELELVRNGLLLPILPINFLKHRLPRIIVDFLFAVASLLAARWIHDLSTGQRGLWFESSSVLFLAALIQIGLLAVGGLYRSSYRLANAEDGLIILRSVLYASFGTWALSLPFGSSAFPAFQMMFMDLYFLATLVAGTRVSFYLMDHIFRNARRAARRVVIYGTGEAGAAALHALRQDRNQLTVVGFLDDDEVGSQFQELPVLKSSALNHTPRDFDEIVLATEQIPEKSLHALQSRCRLAQVRLNRFSVNCTELEDPVGRTSNPGERREPALEPLSRQSRPGSARLREPVLASNRSVDSVH